MTLGVTQAQGVTAYVGGAIGSAITVLPSGDTTGATDGAAINAALAAGNAVELAANATYYSNVTIQLKNNSRLHGAGVSTHITGVNISTAVVQVALGASGAGLVTMVYCGGFTIDQTGTTPTYAFFSNGSVSSGNLVLVFTYEDMFIGAGNFTNGFRLEASFGGIMRRIQTTSSLITNACFWFGGACNANVYDNLYTSNNGANYNFYLQDDIGNGTSKGNTYNGLTAQGAIVNGLYVGGSHRASTFNGFYAENAVNPIRLGNKAGNNLCVGLTFNSPHIGVVSGTNSAYANRVACIDFDNCVGVTVNSPSFEGAVNLTLIAPLTFSGGGSPTKVAQAAAIVNASGVIVAAIILHGGTGYGSDPSIAVGGVGTGASVTCTQTAGVVTTITLVSGGTGFINAPMVPARYNASFGCVIANAYMNGQIQPLYPFIVRNTSASTTAGLNTRGDLRWSAAGSGTAANADLMRLEGFGYAHMLYYYDSAGTQQKISVIPPVFP